MVEVRDGKIDQDDLFTYFNKNRNVTQGRCQDFHSEGDNPPFPPPSFLSPPSARPYPPFLFPPFLPFHLSFPLPSPMIQLRVWGVL